jgi:hypothetical protein
MAHSKYIRPTRTPERHVKRTIPIWGAEEETGVWFRCWYCGFINDSRVRIVADTDTDGKSYAVSVQQPDLKAAGMSFADDVVMPSYNPVFEEVHMLVGTANQGCAFCGSLNYR